MGDDGQANGDGTHRGSIIPLATVFLRSPISHPGNGHAIAHLHQIGRRCPMGPFLDHLLKLCRSDRPHLRRQSIDSYVGLDAARSPATGAGVMGEAAILLLMRWKAEPTRDALRERAMHFDARSPLPICAG